MKINKHTLSRLRFLSFMVALASYVSIYSIENAQSAKTTSVENIDSTSQKNTPLIILDRGAKKKRILSA